MWPNLRRDLVLWLFKVLRQSPRRKGKKKRKQQIVLNTREPTYPQKGHCPGSLKFKYPYLTSLEDQKCSIPGRMETECVSLSKMLNQTFQLQDSMVLIPQDEFLVLCWSGYQFGRLARQSTIDWVDSNRNVFSHSPGGCKSKIKVISGLVSSEAAFLGWQLAVFLCLHMMFPVCVSLSKCLLLLVRTPVVLDQAHPNDHI